MYLSSQWCFYVPQHAPHCSSQKKKKKDKADANGEVSNKRPAEEQADGPTAAADTDEQPQKKKAKKDKKERKDKEADGDKVVGDAWSRGQSVCAVIAM